VDAATDGINLKGGIGGFFNGRYFGVPLDKLLSKGAKEHRSAAGRRLFPVTHRKETMHITYLELFVVWWAMIAFDKEWQGLHLTIHTDNEGVRYMLNKGTSKKPHFMPIIRAITQRMAVGGYRIRAERVTSEANVLADPLSRGDWKRFHREFAKWKQENPGLMKLARRSELGQSHTNPNGNLGPLPFVL
jgi:GH24 family phage-related lysozyme (muramidase)